MSAKETLNLPRAPLCMIVATALVSSCAGGHGSDHHRKDPPGPPVFHEQEPNDSPYFADFIGPVDAHTDLVIEGHVEAFGTDLYDHFEFVAEEPIGIEFRLQGHTLGADIDLCIIDLDTGEVVACYDSPHDYEEGYFTVDWSGKHFVLMVESVWFDTHYDLEISAYHYLSEESGEEANFAPPTEGNGFSFPEGRPSPEKAKNQDGQDADAELERELAIRSIVASPRG